eukprot:448861-Rhodomonas_salina.1
MVPGVSVRRHPNRLDVEAAGRVCGCDAVPGHVKSGLAGGSSRRAGSVCNGWNLGGRAANGLRRHRAPASRERHRDPAA